MSDIDNIISHIKTNNAILNKQLPASLILARIERPLYSFQSQIIDIFENSKSNQHAIIRYRKFLNDYVTSNLKKDDVEYIDKIYYLFCVANLLYQYKGVDFDDILEYLEPESERSDLVVTISDKNIDYEFGFVAPSIAKDNKYLNYALSLVDEDNFTLTDYAFCDIFRFVDFFKVDKTTVHTNGIISIDNLNNFFKALPINVCEKLVDSVDKNYTKRFLNIQKDLDIEHDPEIFIDIK